MKERSRMFLIPIYGYSIEIVATESVEKSYNKPSRLKRLQGTFSGDVWGLHAYCGSKSTLFFSIEGLTHNTIAHECFHATNWVSSYFGINKDKSDEAVAWLNGYIAELIYSCLKSWKLRIK